MRLLLIRHGQTPSNVAGALDTAIPGAGLTELGQRQAAAIPPALRNVTIGAVFASRLIRTQLTAQPLATARSLPVQVRDGLEEISAGTLEMRTDRAARAEYRECVDAWPAGDLGRQLAGGEDGHGFMRRFDDALNAIHREGGEDVVVFSSGSAIRVYTVLRTQAFSSAEAVKLRIANTGNAWLTRDDSPGWRLVSWSPEPLGGADLDDATARDLSGRGETPAGEGIR